MLTASPLRRRPRRLLASLAFVPCVVAIACSGPPERTPLPADLADRATVPGIPGARTWADEAPPYVDRILTLPAEELKDRFPAVYGRRHSYLALSGGGPRGAFGAGLLVGWTERGTRPEFSFVTGVSTGALMAPFAFLGSDYDHVLEELYTTYSTEDLVEQRSWLGIAFGDAIADATRMREQLARLVDAEVMEAIAAEYRRGRGLQIVTTNLDAGRPVAWNVGWIAASGAPGALELIHDVIMASAAIPVAFPPVVFEVEADGQRYDELHVDGGVTSNVFLYPIGLDWDALSDRLRSEGRPDVYVIRNGYLKERWSSVDRSLVPIAGATVSVLLGAVASGDIYRIYLATQRDQLDYHLAYVPESFDHEELEPFDREFMQALFELGRSQGRAGYPWADAPPGYDTDEEAALEG